MDFSAWATFFTHLPIDWILIAAVVIFVALDALRSGSARAAALVLSLPATLLVVQEIPKAVFMGQLSAQFSAPLPQLTIFIVFAVILYIAAYRLISSFSDGATPIQAIVAGLAAAVVLLVVWVQVPGLDSLWHFGGQVQMIFGAAYRFWWLLGSYTILGAVRG